jgi:hypothetical protein
VSGSPGETTTVRFTTTPSPAWVAGGRAAGARRASTGGLLSTAAKRGAAEASPSAPPVLGAARPARGQR